MAEELLSTLLLCRKKTRQSNRKTSVYFVTLSPSHTLYLFDKTRVAETGKRERKGGSGRRKKHWGEVKRRADRAKEPHSRAQIAAMTTRKGPDGLLEEAL